MNTQSLVIFLTQKNIWNTLGRCVIVGFTDQNEDGGVGQGVGDDHEDVEESGVTDHRREGDHVTHRLSTV